MRLVIHDTDKGDLSVPITAIAENYLYHYIYMTPACYEKVYGEAPEYNTLLVNVTEEQQENNHDIGGDILALGGVLNVTYTDTISGQMNDMLGSEHCGGGTDYLCRHAGFRGALQPEQYQHQ